MGERQNLVDQIYRSLDQVAPDDMMPVVRAALVKAVGATDVALVLADYAELSLERFDHERSGAPPEGRSLSIESTVPGECYRRQEVMAHRDEQGSRRWAVYAPVTVRSERFGVLEVDLPEDPTAEVREASA